MLIMIGWHVRRKSQKATTFISKIHYWLIAVHSLIITARAGALAITINAIINLPRLRSANIITQQSIITTSFHHRHYYHYLISFALRLTSHWRRWWTEWQMALSIHHRRNNFASHHHSHHRHNYYYHHSSPSSTTTTITIHNFRASRKATLRWWRIDNMMIVVY